MTAAPTMAAAPMTEMFTMIAAVTVRKPAGKAVVRIVAFVVREDRYMGNSLRSTVGIGVIIVSVVRIVGVVTVISAPARKQGGHQQSRQNSSSRNLLPPAPDRFQLGKTSYLFKLGAGSKVVYLWGCFGAASFFCRCQEDARFGSP